MSRLICVVNCAFPLGFCVDYNTYKYHASGFTVIQNDRHTNLSTYILLSTLHAMHTDASTIADRRIASPKKETQKRHCPKSTSKKSIHVMGNLL